MTEALGARKILVAMLTSKTNRPPAPPRLVPAPCPESRLVSSAREVGPG